MLPEELGLVCVVRRGGIGVCCQKRWNWCVLPGEVKLVCVARRGEIGVCCQER